LKVVFAERVRAGLRNAKAKGKHLGRPRVEVDRGKIANLRSDGHAWAAIAKKLGVGEGTMRRAAASARQDHISDKVRTEMAH
jgi:putative DNA-invertase from lambdoid prophage Rac